MPEIPGLVIRKLEKGSSENDTQAAINVLANAFENDKFNYLIIGGLKDLLAEQLGAVLRAGLIGGSVYVAETKDDGIIGSAVWFGPGQELLDSEEQSEGGFNQFMEELTKRYQEMHAWWMEYFLPVYAEYAAKFFGNGYKLSGWHLQLLGVENRFQRHKVGTNLIRYMEREIKQSGDSNAKHICLETEAVGSLAFYKAIGFEERGKFDLQGEKKLADSVPMWYVSKSFV